MGIMCVRERLLVWLKVGTVSEVDMRWSQKPCMGIRTESWLELTVHMHIQPHNSHVSTYIIASQFPPQTS